MSGRRDPYYGGYRPPSPEYGGTRERRFPSGYQVTEGRVHHVESDPRVSPIPRRPVLDSLNASPYPAYSNFGTPTRFGMSFPSPRSPRSPTSPTHFRAPSPTNGDLRQSSALRAQEVENMKSRTEQLRRETATLRRTLANYPAEVSGHSPGQSPTSPRQVESNPGASKTNNEAIAKLTDLVTDLRRQLEQARSESTVDQLRRAEERIKSLELEVELSKLAQPSKSEELLVAQQTVKAQASSLEHMRVLCKAQQDKIDVMNEQELRLSQAIAAREDAKLGLKDVQATLAGAEGREAALRDELGKMRRAMEQQREVIDAQRAQIELLNNKVETAVSLPTPPVSMAQVSMAPSQGPQRHASVSEPRSPMRHPSMVSDPEPRSVRQESLSVADPHPVPHVIPASQPVSQHVSEHQAVSVDIVGQIAARHPSMSHLSMLSASKNDGSSSGSHATAEAEQRMTTSVTSLHQATPNASFQELAPHAGGVRNMPSVPKPNTPADPAADDDGIVVPAGLSLGWFKPPPGYPQPPKSIASHVMANKDKRHVEQTLLPDESDVVRFVSGSESQSQPSQHPSRASEPSHQSHQQSSHHTQRAQELQGVQPESQQASEVHQPPFTASFASNRTEEQLPSHASVTHSVHHPASYRSGQSQPQAAAVDRQPSAASMVSHHSAHRSEVAAPVSEHQSHVSHHSAPQSHVSGQQPSDHRSAHTSEYHPQSGMDRQPSATSMVSHHSAAPSHRSEVAAVSHVSHHSAAPSHHSAAPQSHVSVPQPSSHRSEPVAHTSEHQSQSAMDRQPSATSMVSHHSAVPSHHSAAPQSHVSGQQPSDHRSAHTSEYHPQSGMDRQPSATSMVSHHSAVPSHRSEVAAPVSEHHSHVSHQSHPSVPPQSHHSEARQAHVSVPQPSEHQSQPGVDRQPSATSMVSHHSAAPSHHSAVPQSHASAPGQQATSMVSHHSAASHHSQSAAPQSHVSVPQPSSHRSDPVAHTSEHQSQSGMDRQPSATSMVSHHSAVPSHRSEVAAPVSEHHSHVSHQSHPSVPPQSHVSGQPPSAHHSHVSHHSEAPQSHVSVPQPSEHQSQPGMDRQPSATSMVSHHSAAPSHSAAPQPSEHQSQSGPPQQAASVASASSHHTEVVPRSEPQSHTSAVASQPVSQQSAKPQDDDDGIVVPAGLSLGWFKPPPGYPQPPKSIASHVMANKDKRHVEQTLIPDESDVVQFPREFVSASDSVPETSLRSHQSEPLHVSLSSAYDPTSQSAPDMPRGPPSSKSSVATVAADRPPLTPPQRTLVGDEHSPAEKQLVDDLHIGYEVSDGMETDRSMSATSFVLSQQRRERLQEARPVYHVAAMVGAGGGSLALPGLTSLLRAAPAPQDLNTTVDDFDMTREFHPGDHTPLSLSLPATLHDELLRHINADEVDMEGLRVLRVSSPRSKMLGLSILESAGHQVQPVEHHGLDLLVLASPRSGSPGLDALAAAASQQ